MSAFTIARIPELHFGAGKINQLGKLIGDKAKRALIITGQNTLDRSKVISDVIELIIRNGTSVEIARINKEPEPAMIDKVVSQFAGRRYDVVAGIGGGSVVDAGKAIAAMLTVEGPVREYLEGVGTRSHPGTSIPYIAIPTTAGTGSEATKNAVLSEVGVNGFKRSLRHNNFIPTIALIDPSLTISCPPSITASSGMDAFTQLLESFLSPGSSPMTDALALEGLKNISSSLKRAYADGGDIEARTGMSWAAYLSGITLANAGLGTVHGFASSVGGYFDIPHGVVCSALMGPVNRITVKRLREKNDVSFLKKYSVVGRLFESKPESDQYSIDSLLDTIDMWCEQMKIPELGKFGVTKNDITRIVAVTDNKYNPVKLSKEDLCLAVEQAI